MIVRFCENLFLRIRERQKVYSDRVLSGTFQTLEEYKKIIGLLQGLEEAETIIKKLYKDMFDTKLIDRNTITQEEDNNNDKPEQNQFY